MGGIDWAGLPIVAEILGIRDVQRLVERLLVIRTYKPKEHAHGNGNTLD